MLTARAIPESLKAYGPEILAGLAAADRRRAELANAWGYPPRRPQPVELPQPFDKQSRTNEPQTLEQSQPENTAVIPQFYCDPKPAALQAVKFWPLVGIAAAKHNEGGAWRAWTLAKNLDKPGRGAIPLDDLQALAGELGIHAKTWRRWLRAARRLTLIRDRASADGWVVLASHQAAAVLLGCEYAGPRPASIAACDLAGPGWRAYVWAAYEATHNGRPISRAKQQDMTGVPVSTQRAYDNQAGVDRRPNYAISDRPADELAGVAEFEGRAAPFKFWDKKGRRWVIAWRLPDSRTASAAESLQRGRSRKISKAIKRLTCKRYNGLSILGQAESYDAGGVKALRLFHTTGQQVRAAVRKLAQADLPQPGEFYLFKHAGQAADFWHVLPQEGGLAA